MKKRKCIIKKTPFLYENGKTYYFDIAIRSTSSIYYDLYVYEKKVTRNKFHYLGSFFKDVVTYECFNDTNPELVGTRLNIEDVKEHIKNVLRDNIRILVDKIDGWDGVVGNIPTHMIVAMKREQSLNELLDSNNEEN